MPSRARPGTRPSQRIDFVERFQKLIDDYNTGSKTIGQFFEELKHFARCLTAEEKRGVALGLSELAIFDILTQPNPVLTREQELDVRRLAKDLLSKLKAEKLILDRRLKQQARAGVQKTIRDVFRTLPQPYTSDLRQEKAARAYGFVYDKLPKRGKQARRASMIQGVEANPCESLKGSSKNRSGPRSRFFEAS